MYSDFKLVHEILISLLCRLWHLLINFHRSLHLLLHHLSFSVFPLRPKCYLENTHLESTQII